MTSEDKQKYFNYKNLKNKIKPFYLVLTLILGLSFTFWGLGLIISLIEFETSLIGTGVIMSILFYIFTKLSYKASIKDKKLIKKIMNGNMYYVYCYSYDKKIKETSDTNRKTYINYYIKVTDKKYVVNKWLEVPKSIYLSGDEIKVKLIIFDETGKDIFEIVEDF